MTRPGIEPRYSGPLANTLLVRPMSWVLIIQAPILSGNKLLRLIKWRLASVLKIEKCRHTVAKNSKLGGKNKEPFSFGRRR